MGSKIKVRICTGTACFVMGGSELLLLEDNLPDNLRGLVEISGTTCMDFCKDSENGKSPFAEIDGVVVSEASLHKVISYIEEIVTSNRN